MRVTPAIMGAAGAAAIPSGPAEIAFADFQNGVYRVNGSAAVLGDIFEEDSFNYLPFDPADIQGGVGYVQTGNEGPVFVAALASTIISGGAQFVLDFTAAGAGDPHDALMHIEITDFPDYNREFNGEWNASGGAVRAGGGLTSDTTDMANGIHTLTFVYYANGNVSLQLDALTPLTATNGGAAPTPTDVGLQVVKSTLRSITVTALA